jgi:hypothetical protein
MSGKAIHHSLLPVRLGGFQESIKDDELFWSRPTNIHFAADHNPLNGNENDPSAASSLTPQTQTRGIRSISNQSMSKISKGFVRLLFK